MSKSPKSRSGRNDDEEILHAEVVEDVVEVIEEGPLVEVLPAGGRGRGKGTGASGGRGNRGATSGSSRLGKLWGVFSPSVRPGEQEVLKSPLVLGLGGGLLALLLAAATLYLMIGRHKAQQKFDAADASLNQHMYAQAIEQFELFIREYPNDPKTGEARAKLSTARVEKALVGTTPNWKKGLEELEAIVKLHRDTEEFKDSASEVRKFVVDYAAKISLGAAEQTKKTGERAPHLTTSEQALRLLEQYAPSDPPPTEKIAQIKLMVRAAESSATRFETFVATKAEIASALEKQTPHAALAARRKLLERYTDYKGNRELTQLESKILEQEKNLVQREELTRDAEREERPALAGLKGLTLARRTRIRSDLNSLGNVVWAMSDDCCFAVDTVTGEPLWRRPLGSGGTFFPVAVQTSVPAWLVFDTRHQDLVLLEQKSGRLLWRQSLGDLPAGAPLVHEGQIYLAGKHGRELWQLDAISGKLTARLKFTQPLSGTPVVSHDGERLFVAGHEQLLYVLTRRPLSCERAFVSGHAPAAIQAPLMMMRHYLLIAENDRQQSGRLRLFDTTQGDKVPVEIAGARMNGPVFDQMVLRGKQLYVPSQPERLTAFTVSESGDQKSLAQVATFQTDDPADVPMFITPGADDYVWTSSTSLRKLQLTKDAFKTTETKVAVGISSQPAQLGGESLFLGRRLPYSRTVLFAEFDRQRMAGQWAVALGCELLATTPVSSKDGSVICVSALGDLFQVTPAKLSAGGFELQPLTTLTIPEGVTTPLRARSLADGRIAVHAGGPTPRVWIITAEGTLAQELKPSQPLQADPVPISGGWLVPLPGKLSVLGRTNLPAVEDWQTRQGGEGAAPRWVDAVSLDDQQALVLDERGRITRVQVRTSPVPHVAEVSHWEAGAPVDSPLLFVTGKVIVTDREGRVRLLDGQTLEPQAELKLSAPATQSPWTVGPYVLVNAGNRALICAQPSQKLAQKWQLPLEGETLAGPPLLRTDGTLLVALTTGKLLLVDPETGTPRHTVTLAQTLHLGLRQWGPHLIAPTLDGTLLSLPEAALAK